jgi:hypothetical protein
MLTRSQVAKRLGKSIATVRRLEGSALHPIQDRDGVHRFDAREVDAVKHGRSSSFTVQWTPARAADESDDDAPLESTRSEEEARLDSARRVELDLREQLITAKVRIAELTRRLAELRESDSARADPFPELLFDWLDSRSKRQLRQLALGGMEELLESVAALDRAFR